MKVQQIKLTLLGALKHMRSKTLVPKFWDIVHKFFCVTLQFRKLFLAMNKRANIQCFNFHPWYVRPLWTKICYLVTSICQTFGNLYGQINRRINHV